MKKFLSFFLPSIFLFSNFSNGQNLCPNPSFEDYSRCPATLSEVGAPGQPTAPVHWYRPTNGSPDYFNACDPGPVASVPNNTFGNKVPRTGDAYAGMHIYTGFTYKEYIQANLTQPMVAGHQYYVSFWVSASQMYRSWYLDQLGAHFSNGYVDSPLTTSLHLIPQVKSPKGKFLSQNLEWDQVEGYFVAAGGEDNIILGNFTLPPDQDTSKRGPTGSTQAVYYYFDDVCVLDITAASRSHDTFVCDSTITLTAPSGYKNYLWSTGAKTSSIKAGLMGTYWVRSSSECAISVDTFHIKQKNLIPSFSLGNDTVICDGSFIDLQIPSYPDVTYTWEDGANGTTHRVKESGKYWLELSIDQCFKTDTIDVVIENYYQNLGDDIDLLCNGIKQTVKLTASNVPDGADVEWSNGTHGYSIIVEDSGTYWVYVHRNFNLNGNQFSCSGRDTVVVNIQKCECFLEAPNAFTPNNDGINDVFRPIIDPTCPVKGYVMEIYNRYGQRVYVSRDHREGWDGTINGKPADVGVYFYTIHFSKGMSTEEYFKKSDLTLIR